MLENTGSSIPEDAAREYAEKMNPNASSRVEKIGDALAMIHEGIPITAELQRRLFGKMIEGETPTFDYVDMDTRNLIDQHPENTESIREEFESYRKRGLVKDEILTHPHYKRMNFEQFSEQVKRERKQALEAPPDSFVPGGELRSEHQNRTVADRMNDLFGDESENVEQLFLETVRKDPHKPFLILYGHGGAAGFLRPKWQVGEEDIAMTADLSTVFDHLDVKKYSTILLVACNEKRLKPPKVEGVSIFHADSVIGLGTQVFQEIPTQRPAKVQSG